MFTSKLRQLARRPGKGALAGPFSSRARAILGSRVSARLPSAVQALLVLALANQAAGLLWTWADFSAGQGEAGAVAGAGREKSADADFTVLSAFDPFHRAAPLQPESLAQAAPETSLDLELFGVRASPEGRGTAIVRTPDKKQGAFKVGDAIMPGVTLRAVMADRVVLSHWGATESLFLNPEARNRQLIAPAAKAELRQIDADAILNAVRLSPRMVDGSVRGFAVSPGADAETFRQTGLQPGDVLVAVNGTTLDAPERMAALEARLRGATSVRLEVERAGARQIIEISNAP